MNRILQKTDIYNIKINMVGENDDFKYFGTSISRTLTFFGIIWLFYAFTTFYFDMISR
jgi:hypothetical protein